MVSALQDERQRALDRVASSAGELVPLEDVVTEFSTDHEIALAAVSKNGHALSAVSAELQSDYAIVLAAVSQNGFALQFAAEDLKGSRQVVLAAVSQHGMALRLANEELKNDHEIVLAAVSNCGTALQYASEALTNDQEIVFAAVSSQGWAIQHAADALKDNHWILEAAVAQEPTALMAASDRLLEDESFAVDARQSYYLFKIIALSGRSCVLPVHVGDRDDATTDSCLLRESCRRLGVPYNSNAVLLCGAEVVPKGSPLHAWPGPLSKGVVMEYQLVGSSRACSE